MKCIATQKGKGKRKRMLWIKNGRVINPSTGLDEYMNILTNEGKI